ncbi:MAG: transposase [Deltaproteobacteria bacterium]|nr:transposase [Deltaproteobacteria bacterium]
MGCQSSDHSKIMAKQLGINHPTNPLSQDIRKAIYTTIAIESLNISLRKVTKNRGHFPSDEAMFKLLHLTLRNIAKKWTMPLNDWKSALNQFGILFDERQPPAYTFIYKHL